MMFVLGFMLVQRTSSHWPRQKLRVWAVMMGSWIFGAVAVALTGDPSPVLTFVLIDILAAFAVLRHPRGLAHNIIGCLYVGTITLHVGYVWAGSYFLGSHGYANLEKYLIYQAVLGWIQWSVLMVWSAKDVGAAIGKRLGLVGNAPPDRADTGAGGR
ncbi:MAG: hypothetical protein ACRCXH_01400 [Shewanella sp.]